MYCELLQSEMTTLICQRLVWHFSWTGVTANGMPFYISQIIPAMITSQIAAVRSPTPEAKCQTEKVGIVIHTVLFKQSFLEVFGYA